MALTILMILGAVLTIIPVPRSYKECMLGYKAHCILAPVSTILCVIAAAVSYVVMNGSFTETA